MLTARTIASMGTPVGPDTWDRTRTPSAKSGRTHPPVSLPTPGAARNDSGIHQLQPRHTERRSFGFLGDPRVNVLALNLALDSVAPDPRSPGP